VKVRDSEIYYKIEGNDVKGTVVLLHGFLGSSEVWNTMMPFLQETYKVIRIDLPGHGKSGCIQETIGMDFIAELVIEILQKEKVEKAHFVGHSMGGYVGLEILSKKSNLIKSLTLFNSTAKDDNPQKKKDRLLAVKVVDRTPAVFINAAIENLLYEPNLKRFKAGVNKLQQVALQTSIKGAQASLRGMGLRKNYVDLIRETSKPVLIIAGRFDNTVKYESILEQVENSNIKLVTLASGHMGFLESFEESKNGILNFINN
jgi:pimeloyl-ACP methyl ester carboxylesterase